MCSVAFGCLRTLADHGGSFYHQPMKYQDILTIEPGKRGGKPCVRGMRITVYDVLEYLASGMSHQEILEDFPYLTEEDIRACLAYAADREKRLLIMAA
jgi:uncharacterized protein (DUF433 family)